MQCVSWRRPKSMIVPGTAQPLTRHAMVNPLSPSLSLSLSIYLPPRAPSTPPSPPPHFRRVLYSQPPSLTVLSWSTPPSRRTVSRWATEGPKASGTSEISVFRPASTCVGGEGIVARRVGQCRGLHRGDGMEGVCVWGGGLMTCMIDVVRP